MADTPLRDELIRAAEGRGSHLDYQTATQGLDPDARGRVPPGLAHSPWQIIEHLRLAQRDILDFSTAADAWEPKAWPDEFWPDDPAPPEEQAWDDSTARFLDDRAAFIDLLRDDRRDPLQPFPWGDGQSLAAEAITLAQHNSYHLGELLATRRALRAW